MLINTAKFLMSNTIVSKCPAPDKHEYAFIGRSNVGKSSLINMLVNNRKLAKIAAKPGKTQLINHFLINDAWYLVDLPGYGYAQISKTKRYSFEDMIKEYILKRENLMCLFVLIDSRLPPQKIDLEFMAWLGENGVPFVIIFTKADKLKREEKAACMQNYHNEMLKTWSSTPISFLSSAEKKLGRDELLSYIEELNKIKLT